MRVHLIKKQSIEDFVTANARSRHSFEEWLEKLKRADWEMPADIKATFGTADLLGKHSNRIVFDIGGNTYRLICKYVFGEKRVHLFVCWIGTHAAYDTINANNEQYTVHNY
jgi:mRNA interferase HigB